MVLVAEVSVCFGIRVPGYCGVYFFGAELLQATGSWMSFQFRYFFWLRFRVMFPPVNAFGFEDLPYLLRYWGLGD